MSGGGPVELLVIPAAGAGRRMAALRGGEPKEMLPIGGKPAIRYAVEEGRAAGIGRIVIVVAPWKESIRREFAGENLGFLVQERPLGEADAVALAEPLVGDAPFAILHPDNILHPPGGLRELVSSYRSHGGAVTGLVEVTASTASGLGNSGRVDATPLGRGLYRIDRLHPKGEGTFVPRGVKELRACGLWITGPRFFPLLRRARKEAGAGEFTDGPVKDLLIRERGLSGLLLRRTLHDVGNPEGYRRCRAHCAE